MALQVHQDGTEAVTTPEGKIVDAQKKDHAGRVIGKSHDMTENRLASRLYPQPSGQPSTTFATGCQPDGGDLLVEPDGCSGPRLHKGWQTLGEDFPLAVGVATGELAHGEEQLDTTTR